MKKLLVIVSAAALLAACSKGSVVYDGDSEIGFRPVSKGLSSKAVYGPVGTAYDQNESFRVFAYHKVGGGAGEDWTTFYGDGSNIATYIDNGTFAYNGTYLNWVGSPDAYYWPKTGYLMFAGYSPSSVSGACTPGATPVITVAEFQQGAYDNSTATNQMVDLMWFNANDDGMSSVNNSLSAGNTAIPVQFHHALSWLTFKFYSDIDGEFYLTGATLDNVNSKGSFSGSTAGAAWSGHDSKVTYTLYSNAAGEVLDATGKTADNMLVLPYDFTSDDTYTVTVKFRQGGTDQLEQTATMTLNGSATKEWEAGKHYTYNILISAKPIILDPSVDDWNDQNVGDITVQ